MVDKDIDKFSDHLDKIVKEGNKDFERFLRLQTLIDCRMEEIQSDPYSVIERLIKRNANLYRKLKEIRDCFYAGYIKPDDGDYHKMYKIDEADFNALQKIKKIMREE